MRLDVIPGKGPVQSSPFPVPVSRITAFKNEVAHLVKIGVLVRDHEGSPWTSPSFLIEKKDSTVRFLTDFRKVNDC